MTIQRENETIHFSDRAEVSKTAAAKQSFPVTLDHWRTALRTRLKAISDTPGLDARVLLSHVLQQPQNWLLAHPEYPPKHKETYRLQQALECLLDGEPLPYVLGQWEFFGLTFQLSPEVLIPRPETELLVETALNWLTDYPDRRRAIDIGTGSGCIAVSLAKHCADLNLVAVDISPDALRTARQNTRRHQVDEQIHFEQGNLWEPVRGSFDLICTNLPYIPTATLKSLAIYGREPMLALDGGVDGLDMIREFLAAAPGFLAFGGLLLAEIEASQGSEVLALAREHFPNAQIRILPDLAGHDRLLRIQQR